MNSDIEDNSVYGFVYPILYPKVCWRHPLITMTDEFTVFYFDVLG